LNSTFIKRRLKKAIKLSAGGIKGVLVLLSDLRPDEWPLFFKKIEAHFLDRFSTQRRIIFGATYHLAVQPFAATISTLKSTSTAPACSPKSTLMPRAASASAIPTN